ncbi:MAG: hypothetical protein ACMUJM_07905 [bacterium]
MRWMNKTIFSIIVFIACSYVLHIPCSAQQYQVYMGAPLYMAAKNMYQYSPSFSIVNKWTSLMENNWINTMNIQVRSYAPSIFTPHDFWWTMYPIDTQTEELPEEGHQTQGLMLLIEFEGIEGLSNFVYELQSREIVSLLLASAQFVEENCEQVKMLQQYGLEVGAVYSNVALWDVPYEEQFDIMKTTVEDIEACIGKPVRIFGSRYFAYDENTVRAAEALGIPYVLARGTTGAKATIYQPEEYDVKIFSVSNVSSEKYGTGSLCDYSYWAREGTSEQFREELYGALTFDKISPVSHTYIGGLKAAWNEVYIDFFDNADVVWVDLDTFGSIDSTLPFAEIPQNREVQYTTPKPAVPLEEEPNVANPCALEDFPFYNDQGGNVGDKIVFFHNGTGPMCLDFLDFIATIEYPIEEYLIGDEEFRDALNALKAEFGSSEGVSASFGYFPIIFIRNKAYSGFNETIQSDIEGML